MWSILTCLRYLNLYIECSFVHFPWNSLDIWNETRFLFGRVRSTWQHSSKLMGESLQEPQQQSEKSLYSVYSCDYCAGMARFRHVLISYYEIFSLYGRLVNNWIKSSPFFFFEFLIYLFILFFFLYATFTYQLVAWRAWLFVTSRFCIVAFKENIESECWSTPFDIGPTP